MKYSTIALILSVLSAPAFAAERILTCAVNHIPQGYKGIRVNIISSQNKLKATLFEGTTVSSTATYWIAKIKNGFEGFDRTGQKGFSLLLSNISAENNYIRGVRAALHYAVIGGNKALSTKPSDGFVCGKQIKPYGTN